MAKTWSADNPKAALMARKRVAIVDAALEAFLASGYAEASVNHIAAAAGVSIKTLYRHFESKDDLFSAVMQAACAETASSQDASEGESRPAWYSAPPAEAFPQAGEEYLRHVLSADQLALYRLVARDAHRFPEVGRRYLQETAGGRDATFAGYLDLWADSQGWVVRDKRTAAQVFAGLLKASLFDQALMGLHEPSDAEIVSQAHDASRYMLQLLHAEPITATFRPHLLH